MCNNVMYSNADYNTLKLKNIWANHNFLNKI